jgi:light-regulated signal transduction histidine kinase (bacteriophytochrome)
MQNQDNSQKRLLELQKEMEEFTYIISHDFKAPLRAISNLSSWIEEDLGEDISEDVQQNMALLRNRASRLEGMIEALAQLSRVCNSNLEVRTTDIKEIVKSLGQKYNGRLNIDAKEPLPVFVTYKHKLVQVFEYILDNIVRFSEQENPKAYIRCALITPELYEFSVADNGVGIPENTLEKIFSLFYTISPKDSVNTVGAGLAITKKIVNFAGGKIRAELNQQRNGLIIRFTWPILINNNSDD